MGSFHPHSADEETEAQREAGTYSGRPNPPGLELALTSFVLFLFLFFFESTLSPSFGCCNGLSCNGLLL